MAAPPDRKPILWAFSLSRLDALLESTVPLFASVADIRVFHKGFDDALETARELMRSGAEVDVFLSAGASGAWLRRHAPVPVAVIAPSGFDVLEALAKARRLSRRVGLVSFGAINAELEEFRHVFGIDLEQQAYTTVDDAPHAVRHLASRGVEVIVGPSLILDLAERAGLAGVFVYSQDSVREAIGRAIEIARSARAEEAKRARVDAIVQHLSEGVVAVDRQGRIETLNPAMERLLGVRADAALGLPLARVAPALGLARVIEAGVPELEAIEKVGSRTVVANRIPLRDQGVPAGAVLTCQDASAFERVDRSLRSHNRPRRFVAKYRLSDAIGRSPAIRRARALAERYARTDATVLITGPSGTGKEIFAQGIHAASARHDRPFVAINCAALPETLLESELFGYEEGAFTGSRRGGKVGLFEAAHTGTVFLDEIGELPLALQSRLLRVLQEREVLRLGSNDPTPVDVRVVAATNRDLAASVAAGSFRQDLYYRVEILKLHLPPLDARREDLPLLTEHLLARALRQHGAEEQLPRALRFLLPHVARHAWPGNIRELENVVERVAVLCGAGAAPVGDEELRGVLPEPVDPLRAGAGGRLEEARRRDEEQHIRSVLRECGGNRSEAARRLGIGRTTLWRKLGAARA
jgi:propionate catabolism operon transcriptional regulator